MTLCLGRSIVRQREAKALITRQYHWPPNASPFQPVGIFAGTSWQREGDRAGSERPGRALVRVHTRASPGLSILGRPPGGAGSDGTKGADTFCVPISCFVFFSANIPGRPTAVNVFAYGRRLPFATNRGVVQFLHPTRQFDTQPRKTEQRYWIASIVDLSDDVIISKNLDGIVISWNRDSCVLGYTAEQWPAYHDCYSARPPTIRQILTRIRRRRIERY